MTTHLFQLLFLTFFITIVSCNEVAQLKNEVIEYNEDSKEKNVQPETTVTNLKAGNFLKPLLSFARNILILFRLTWPFGRKEDLEKKLINECDSNPCQLGSSCKDLEDGYKCLCVPEFSGKKCEFNVDECLTNPCAYWQCFDEGNGNRCECIYGYYGKEANYRLIDGLCIYYETEKLLNYKDAKESKYFGQSYE